MEVRMEVKELERRYRAALQELYEVDQILGEALGFPRYCDDPKNFPEATEADGVCTGEMTPTVLATLAAHKIKFLRKGIDVEEKISDSNRAGLSRPLQ